MDNIFFSLKGKIEVNNYKNVTNLVKALKDKNLNIEVLKHIVEELQKNVDDNLGQRFKEALLKYYHDKDFLNLSLTFIDGHVIAYFGKEAFQKLKHGTRDKIIKSLEVFNFSDKNGRIFYFKADHDVIGMQKNIEELLDEVEQIIGLSKIRILVFDRGGYCGELFKKLKGQDNKKYAV